MMKPKTPKFGNEKQNKEQERSSHKEYQDSSSPKVHQEQESLKLNINTFVKGNYSISKIKDIIEIKNSYQSLKLHKHPIPKFKSIIKNEYEKSSNYKFIKFVDGVNFDDRLENWDGKFETQIKTPTIFRKILAVLISKESREAFSKDQSNYLFQEIKNNWNLYQLFNDNNSSMAKWLLSIAGYIPLNYFERRPDEVLSNKQSNTFENNDDSEEGSLSDKNKNLDFQNQFNSMEQNKSKFHSIELLNENKKNNLNSSHFLNVKKMNKSSLRTNSYRNLRMKDNIHQNNEFNNLSEKGNQEKAFLQSRKSQDSISISDSNKFVQLNSFIHY